MKRGWPMACPLPSNCVSGHRDRAAVPPRHNGHWLTHGRVAPYPAKPANLLHPIEVVRSRLVMGRGQIDGTLEELLRLIQLALHQADVTDIVTRLGARLHLLERRYGFFV